MLKMADFWRFFLWLNYDCNFFENISDKMLDFLEKCAHTMRAFKLGAHTMRAFKLGTVQKQISTPEISAVNGTTNGKGNLLNTQTL